MKRWRNEQAHPSRFDSNVWRKNAPTVAQKGGGMNAFKEVLSIPVITLIALLTVYGWVMTEDYNAQHIVAANGD